MSVTTGIYIWFNSEPCPVNLLQYDLELIFVKNSHEFVHDYMKKPEYVELMRRLGALGDGNQDRSKYYHKLLFPPYNCLAEYGSRIEYFFMHVMQEQFFL